MHFIDVQKPYTPSHIRQMLLNLAMDLEARRDLWKYPTAKQIEAEEADPNLMDERWFLVFGRSLEETFVRNGLADILKWLDFRHPSVAFEIHSLTDQLTKLIPAKPNIGLDDQDHIIVQLAQAAFHLRQYADSIPIEESSEVSQKNSDNSKKQDAAELDVVSNEIEEVLSTNKQDILKAMLENGAIDSDSRITADKIVVAVAGPDVDSGAFKDPLADLTKGSEPFLNSRTGRGGGYWLTKHGISRAKKL